MGPRPHLCTASPSSALPGRSPSSCKAHCGSPQALGTSSVPTSPAQRGGLSRTEEKHLVLGRVGRYGLPVLAGHGRYSHGTGVAQSLRPRRGSKAPAGSLQARPSLPA